MEIKPDWCDWWTSGDWQRFVRLLKAIDRGNLYATRSGDEDLRMLAGAVRESPAGKWSVTIKDHLSRCQQQVTLDRQGFAEQVLDAMTRAGMHNAWYDHENFAICPEGEGEPLVLHLGPTFTECQQAAPSEVADRIAKLVSLATSPDEPLDTWHAVRDRLRPVLRAATYGLDTALAHDMWPLARPALPFLEERVVVDLPAKMQYVMASHLTDWGVTPEDVFATARANLAGTAPRPDTPADGPTVLRFVDEDGDLYLSSLPLLDGWLDSMASAVGGRPVAFMPDHASLIVATDTETGIPEILQMVEADYTEAARALSPLAYTVDESGAVIPYPAPDGHPAGPAVRRATAILAATEYDAQKTCLDEHHEAELIPTFVASLLVTENDETLTVWGEDVDSLLPRADCVAFVGEDSEPCVVPWESVAEAVTLTPVDGVSPPRYRVHNWPTADVMKQLRTKAKAMQLAR